MARPPEVIVVTGASAGLGRAIVREFAREGAHIGLIARGRERLETTRAEVEQLGGRALVLPLDVADADAVEQAADRIERSPRTARASTPFAVSQIHSARSCCTTTAGCV